MSEEEREVCLHVLKKLKGSSEKVHRAHILLKADDGDTLVAVKRIPKIEGAAETITEDTLTEPPTQVEGETEPQS